MINGHDFTTCCHCGGTGKLGTELRIYSAEIPGQTKRAVRVLHIVRCCDEWFGKYRAWVAEAAKLRRGDAPVAHDLSQLPADDATVARANSDSRDNHRDEPSGGAEGARGFTLEG